MSHPPSISKIVGEGMQGWLRSIRTTVMQSVHFIFWKKQSTYLSHFRESLRFRNKENLDLTLQNQAFKPVTGHWLNMLCIQCYSLWLDSYVMESLSILGPQKSTGPVFWPRLIANTVPYGTLAPSTSSSDGGVFVISPEPRSWWWGLRRAAGWAPFYSPREQCQPNHGRRDTRCSDEDGMRSDEWQQKLQLC